MSFLNLARTRQSTRQYADKPIEREKIERCLESARLAPSACNSQPWYFLIIDDPALKDAVAQKTFGGPTSLNKFSIQAPVLAVIITERPSLQAQFGAFVKNLPFHFIDIGIAAEHFCLQAAEEGLGTCMMGWFNQRDIKKALNIPNNKKIALLIAVGYPAKDDIREKKRKSIEEIREYNQYQK
ncbi:MAG: nitroreductase family protein [Candidatus Margulisiibacteriota bacterium]